MSARIGTYTIAMIASPKTLAERTSSVAPSITPSRSVGVSKRASRCCPSVSRRTAFSTMMTAPSTMSPKSMAPRLIRLPESPAAFMTTTANRKRQGDGRRHDDAGAEIAEQE